MMHAILLLVTAIYSNYITVSKTCMHIKWTTSNVTHLSDVTKSCLTDKLHAMSI